MSGPEVQKQIATIKETFYESRTWILTSLSDKTSIKCVTGYRVITQMLKI